MLMHGCLYKYKSLVDRGTWEALDSQEKIMLALKLIVEHLSKKLKSNSTNSFQANKKGQSNKEGKTKSTDKIPHRWYFISPIERESRVQKWFAVGFIISAQRKTASQKEEVCENWLQHTPAQCEGRSFAQKPKANAKTSKTKTAQYKTPKTNNKRELQVKMSTAAVHV